ncbi:MAG: hypothetical protein A3C85_01435 [Candidatus Doudnabacteria bacterium RIFCSPHIGHO2_02_FULL_48_21]|uniref:Uncharacterized protein n=1 Tax=Candidatus Doudnabacteria bacterium RIFCSPLOWO2_02_FULL_48_13 TaxID=1817845 RepID=A0A1F5Q8W4_9BACT|nr:MAG: hypothetical protein A3K05_03055 [Candidatus Doudnabacteria bacterium RIFCSPHIGHO2_01_48_18]OGE93946.1 MAG: hypothetical protein A3C85_01435 [Candidatus Doudnabacteria bacterium RIFCSPHIGHO2_02_FULL_48_21]OGE98625.1 MAG: hypothetical protein A3J05_00975 [Candidatus Doudnabacteria bacterium RIFCSPLOWO2_02_FULL_48_13]
MQNVKFYRFTLSLYILTFQFLIFSVTDATIGISPDRIVFDRQNNEQILFLRNLGTEIEQISVTSQSKDVQIHSGQMYLRPDEAASVRISKTSQNDFRTELAVVALSESGADLGLASGVKIPVTAKSRSAFVLALPYLLALAVTAGSYFVLKKRN